MSQTATYPATLADLNLFADCTAELDGLKIFAAGDPEEHARLTAMIERLHDTVERIAGPDRGLLYEKEPPREPTAIDWDRVTAAEAAA